MFDWHSYSCFSRISVSLIGFYLLKTVQSAEVDCFIFHINHIGVTKAASGAAVLFSLWDMEACKKGSRSTKTGAAQKCQV